MSILNNDVFVGFASVYTASALEIEGNKLTGETALKSMSEWLVSQNFTPKTLASGTDARKELKQALRMGLPAGVQAKLNDPAVSGDTVVITRKGKKFTKRETIQRVDGTYTSRVVKYVEKLLSPNTKTSDRDRTIADCAKMLKRLQGNEITGFNAGEVAKLTEHVLAMAKILK